jgi:ribosomal protein S18 acetylase RimI-like enzyme
MTMSASISRLAAYYTRRGLGATIRRAALAVSRGLFSNRMVLFYCDLSGQTSWPADLPSSVEIERKSNEAELSPKDLHEVIDVWNPKLAHRNIKQRFDRGASLWMIKSDGRLAGYGWTLQGSTVEPHYFPLKHDDVHLFDFHVFPQYRGQGLNPLLVTHILRNLAVECGGRAFIEAAEWNQAQLSSLMRTPFRRLGWARKSIIIRRTIVCRDEVETRERNPKDEFNASINATGRKASGVPR